MEEGLEGRVHSGGGAIPMTRPPPHFHHASGRKTGDFRADDHESRRARFPLYALSIQPYSNSGEAIRDRSPRKRGVRRHFRRRVPTEVPPIGRTRKSDFELKSKKRRKN